MTIAVLAVQGAFIEHEKMLKKLGVSCIELRKAEDLNNHYDGIILPGGESTVQGKLLRELGMFDTLKTQIENGMPVLATCAGMILLASDIENQNEGYFKTINMTVKRNAYGRQLGSFYAEGAIDGMENIPMTFIRAPYVSKVADNVNVLAKVDNHIVAVQYKKQIALAFHPELNDDTRIHEKFISLCK